MIHISNKTCNKRNILAVLIHSIYEFLVLQVPQLLINFSLEHAQKRYTSLEGGQSRGLKPVSSYLFIILKGAVVES